MKSRLFIVLAAAAAVTLTGCTTNKKLAELQSRHDALQQEYSDTKVALAESRANARNLEQMLEGARKNNEDLKKAYEIGRASCRERV